MKNCKDCKYAKWTNWYEDLTPRFGRCEYPLPVWVEQTSPILAWGYPEENCVAYEQPTPKTAK